MPIAWLPSPKPRYTSSTAQAHSSSMDSAKKQDPVCGDSTSMHHIHTLHFKQAHPATSTHHISSPSTTTTKMTCQPRYQSPSSNKAKLHRHHLRRFQSSLLQRHQRKSRPQQPHEHVRLHHPHAPRSIIDGHMIYHPQETSSNISTVQSDLQKSQPSYKPSKKGTTDPFQASAWRMSPDTAPKMQQPQYWDTSRKHRKVCARHDGPQQHMHS